MIILLDYVLEQIHTYHLKKTQQLMLSEFSDENIH